jgi:hypothetical protein
LEDRQLAVGGVGGDEELPQAVAVSARLAVEGEVRFLGCLDAEVRVGGAEPIGLVGGDAGPGDGLGVIEIARGADHRGAAIRPLVIRFTSNRCRRMAFESIVSAMRIIRVDRVSLVLWDRPASNGSIDSISPTDTSGIVTATRSSFAISMRRPLR